MRIPGKPIKDTIKNCELEILKLNKEKDLLEGEINDFDDKNKWIDWVGKYQDRLKKEGYKTDEEKREFLNQVITRIDVKVKNKTQHEFYITFKLPVVNDSLDKKSDRRTKYINPNRDNEIDEFIHSDLFRHCGVNFIDSLTIVS